MEAGQLPQGTWMMPSRRTGFFETPIRIGVVGSEEEPDLLNLTLK